MYLRYSTPLLFTFLISFSTTTRYFVSILSKDGKWPFYLPFTNVLAKEMSYSSCVDSFCAYPNSTWLLLMSGCGKMLSEEGSFIEPWRPDILLLRPSSLLLMFLNPKVASEVCSLKSRAVDVPFPEYLFKPGC